MPEVLRIFKEMLSIPNLLRDIGRFPPPLLKVYDDVARVLLSFASFGKKPMR